MRHTEQAEDQFGRASTIFVSYADNVAVNYQWEYNNKLAVGLTALAAAIRDIYDKLEVIHKDIRAAAPRR